MTTVINGYVLEGITTVSIRDLLILKGGCMVKLDKSDFTRKFSRELGRDRFNEFKSDLAMANVTWQELLADDLGLKVEEITWKHLMGVYRKMKLSKLHQMHVEVANLEESIQEYNEDNRNWKGEPIVRVPMVTVRNCVFGYKDNLGNDRKEFIECQKVTRKEFEAALMEGTLISALDSNTNEIGSVEGYTDVMDIDIEDFNNSELISVNEILVGSIMTQNGPKEIKLNRSYSEKAITLDHGHGITEVITRDWFLETITPTKQINASIRYLNDAEIKYGWAQEGYDAESTELNNIMGELIRERVAMTNSIEYNWYKEEQMAERERSNTNDKLQAQRKNANELSDAIHNATTHEELRNVVAGKLFPMDQVFNGMTVCNVWLWTMDAVKKEHRAGLMSEFKQKSAAFYRKESFNMWINLEGTQDGAAQLTTQQARNILTYSRENGGQLLNTQQYRRIKDIADRPIIGHVTEANIMTIARKHHQKISLLLLEQAERSDIRNAA